MAVSDITIPQLVDHHVHGVVTGPLDRPAFELLISESGAPPPEGTSHFDTPIGLAIRRHCAPVLDLDPLASPEEYLDRRSALGASEANRRLLSGAGLELAFVETGHRAAEVATPEEMAALAAAPALEVVRVEAVAETLAASIAADEGAPAALVDGLGDAIGHAAAGAVGLKTIAAYRYGLDLPVTRPERPELLRAAGEWLATGRGNGARLRLTSPVLLAHVLHLTLECAATTGLPVQVHAGFGDTDLELHRADPSVFTPWVRRAAEVGAQLVFLHCYPYHRQAGYLAEAFPRVAFDVGCALNYAGPGARRVLAEAMEIAPFTKMLYSSDAFGLAELAYLGAVQFRRSLSAVLVRFVADGDCSVDDAERIARLIASDNARRIYPVDRVLPPPARRGGPRCCTPDRAPEPAPRMT